MRNYFLVAILLVAFGCKKDKDNDSGGSGTICKVKSLESDIFELSRISFSYTAQNTTKDISYFEESIDTAIYFKYNYSGFNVIKSLSAIDNIFQSKGLVMEYDFENTSRPTFFKYYEKVGNTRELVLEGKIQYKAGEQRPSSFSIDDPSDPSTQPATFNLNYVDDRQFEIVISEMVDGQSEEFYKVVFMGNGKPSVHPYLSYFAGLELLEWAPIFFYFIDKAKLQQTESVTTYFKNEMGDWEEDETIDVMNVYDSDNRLKEWKIMDFSFPPFTVNWDCK